MRYLIITFLVLITFNANAGVNTDWGTITELTTNSSGSYIRLRFSEPIQNDGCEGVEYYMKELDETSGSNRFMSTVLAAYTARKQVKFWISGCTSAQFWGKTRPQISTIWVKD